MEDFKIWWDKKGDIGKILVAGEASEDKTRRMIKGGSEIAKQYGKNDHKLYSDSSWQKEC